jgi:hypothetical protein
MLPFPAGSRRAQYRLPQVGMSAFPAARGASPFAARAWRDVGSRMNPLLPGEEGEAE